MTDYNRQIHIKIVKVDGIEYCCTRPGYYYRRAAVGHERISKEEWEEALSYSYMDGIGSAKESVGEQSDKSNGMNVIALVKEGNNLSSSADDFWDGYLP